MYIIRIIEYINIAAFELSRLKMNFDFASHCV